MFTSHFHSPRQDFSPRQRLPSQLYLDVDSVYRPHYNLVTPRALGGTTMNEMAKAVLTAPIATLFIVAGILFLFIAVVGNLSGKIEPGNKARIASAVFGLVFVCLGLTMHWLQKTSGVPELSVVSPLQSNSGQVSNDLSNPLQVLQLYPNKSQYQVVSLLTKRRLLTPQSRQHSLE